MRRFAAERLERLDGVDLGQLAAWRLAVEPGEESRQRHGIALMCRACARDLDRVLDRLEQLTGSLPRIGLPPAWRSAGSARRPR